MNKKIFLGALAAMLLSIVPFSASAAVFQAGQNYSLGSASVVNDNLYVAGANVSMAGKVSGDLLAAGANVAISGPVQADVLAVGGTVNVSGQVGGNLRAAGGNVILSGSTGGETVAAGGSVNYSGTTAKNAYFYAGKVYINGQVNGDLQVSANEVTLGPDAVVSGNFSYSSPKEAVMENGATVKGQVNFNKIAPKAGEKDKSGMLAGLIALTAVLKFLAIALAAIIALYAFKRGTSSVVNQAVSNFWKEAGRGFIILIVTPIAGIISFATLIGLPLGLLALFLYAALIMASVIVSPLVFARLCLKYVFKKDGYETNWWIVILSVLVLGVISLIPIVGWIFSFILFLASMGSLSGYLYGKLKG